MSQGLSRVLGRWDLTAIGVNQVIGSGIFVLPATVALYVGAASSPLVWIAAGIANALIVLCFAEAATRFRGAGGPYLYARTAFGPFLGFEVAWMIWLTRVASQAALANALAIYVGYFWADATEGGGRVLVVTATIVILAAINWTGVRYGSWAINFFTVSKLLPLLGFAFVGLLFVDWSNFAGFLAPRMEGFGTGVLALMFAFGGYELMTIPAGESTSPRKDVPWALLATIALVCGFYCLIQVVAVGTLPGLADSKTPLADAAAGFLGPVAGVLLGLGALVSIGGANAGSMLAAPRVTFALAEGGLLPKFFGHVHRRFRTPDVSILIYATASLLLAWSGTFEETVKASAVARILFYVATCASVLVLRRQQGPVEGAFRTPWGPTIPLLALACSFAIISQANTTLLIAGAIALIVGAALYLLRPRASSGGEDAPS